MAARPPARNPALAGLFIGSIFLSALLLFSVQPMAAKMLLPQFGGSPAVWVTALVLFQVLLVGGYLYAHWLSRWADAGGSSGMPRRWAVHVLVVLLPLAVLPHAIPSSVVAAAGGGWPAARLLLTLLVMVGLPFFVLSTNASLVQRWWSRSQARQHSAVSQAPGSERQQQDDPYWLYAASNAGSLLALLSYSFVVEPALSLPQQTRWWTALYGLFAALTLGALWWSQRRASTSADASAGTHTAREEVAPAEQGRAPAVTHAQRVRWTLRAAVGTSLLMSFSLQISSDLPPAPLLWVVPLALYLVTWIIGFGVRELPRGPLVEATVVALLAAAGVLVVQGRHPVWVVLPVSLGTLLCGCLLCHRDLAAERPAAAGLTSFYLWIALGGALGGVLSSLLAPLLFDSIAELPLTLIALCVLLYIPPRTTLADNVASPPPSAATPQMATPQMATPQMATPQMAVARRLHRLGLRPYRPKIGSGVLAALAFSMPVMVALRDLDVPRVLLLIVVVLVAAWGLAMARYAGVVALSVVLPCVLLLAGKGDRAVLAKERSFFGVVRVQDEGSAIEMTHGTTVHGRQLKDPELHGVPVTYYYPEGPLGSLVAAAPAKARIGVVGLGTGALASATQAGQEIIFYEIDPVVVRLARAHFSYLSNAKGAATVVVGDGRLALAREQGTFDLLIIDAFSSDFVPTHLLTDEALTTFSDKLNPGGLLAVHISNRHTDLRRVLKGYAQAHDRPLLTADYRPTPQHEARGAIPTQAAVLARAPADLRRLDTSPLWSPVSAEVPAVRWTDNHANILSALR